MSGFDPIQRSMQWQKRVNREEIAITRQLLGGFPQVARLNSANARVDMLQQSLVSGTGAIAGPSAPPSSHGSTGGQRLTGTRPAASPLAGAAGGMLTPRLTTPKLTLRLTTPRVGTGISNLAAMGSNAGSRCASRGGLSVIESVAGSEASTLRAELVEERRKRQSVEQELRKLQALVEERPAEAADVATL
mmetsp:Transcript_117483/g.374394  ORF Transcript_117483/g.374394 Transcript_117483/m.374394 type:complete len:190 (-) Transcript_117483:56-625(-)